MKRFLAILLLSFLGTAAIAKGSVGFTAAYNSSRLSTASVSTGKASGFDLGLIYNQPLFLGLAIQPGLEYNLMRAGAIEGKISMSYLKVPVQIQWGPDLIFFRPYVLLEPFAEWVLGGKLALSREEIRIAPSDLASGTDYGLGVGAGVEIRGTLQLSVKYSWNFGNCGLENYIGSAMTSMKERARFNGLSLCVGFLF